MSSLVFFEDLFFSNSVLGLLSSISLMTTIHFSRPCFHALFTNWHTSCFLNFFHIFLLLHAFLLHLLHFDNICSIKTVSQIFFVCRKEFFRYLLFFNERHWKSDVNMFGIFVISFTRFPFSLLNVHNIFLLLCLRCSHFLYHSIFNQTYYDTLYNMYTPRRHLGDKVSSCHKLMRFFSFFSTSQLFSWWQ